MARYGKGKNFAVPYPKMLIGWCDV